MFATWFAGPAVAAAFGLAVATAGTAGAVSSTDNTFLTEISAEGISYDSPKAAIGNAHSVCEALDDGADPFYIGRDILANTDLSTHQAAVFVVTAVDTYCPEYTGYFE
ncbi:DUF732 domain-containing protein [Mycobacterium sp. 3519A]|jgi:hypothetical protein|uniref:DUF732 domain-containing protein n=1 Tax=Mycobacterium sp. 3519A TaxID=2057184 RepID=UPI000C7C3BB5|nr:DUF732 domain-containing protein [Mycobacterium sp. 3519A]